MKGPATSVAFAVVQPLTFVKERSRKDCLHTCDLCERTTAEGEVALWCKQHNKSFCIPCAAGLADGFSLALRLKDPPMRATKGARK